MRLTEHGVPARFDLSELSKSDSKQVRVLSIVDAALVGGALRSPRKRKLFVETDEDDRDDDYQRVHADGRASELLQVQTSNSNRDPPCRTPEDLADIPADVLAEMVQGPDHSINLAHKAFKHERKHWEKILTSPKFDMVNE